MTELMRFHVLDKELRPIGQFNEYAYAEWREAYAETGKLLIECADTAYNTGIAQVGRYVYRPDIGRAMVIRQTELTEASRTLKIRGFSALDRLAQRVINPADTNHTMTVTNIERGIYGIVATNIRGMDGWVNAAAQGFAEATDTKFTGTKVLNAVIRLADEAGFGLAVDCDPAGARLTFRVYKGLDRTYESGTAPRVVFNEQNVNNLVITSDTTPFANFLYVAGQGEGSDRVVVSVPDNPPSGADLFEAWYDASKVERGSLAIDKYRTVLQAKGLEKLGELLQTQSFACDPITEGSYVFRRDYGLGDLVTCDARKYGLRFNARVESCTEISQHGMTILKIQLGKPVLTRTREAI